MTQSPFRTPQGRLRLMNLFVDHRYETEAPYTSEDRDREYKGKIYPSLYRLYMETSDITEYNFATKYLETYQHWHALCQEEAFKPIVERWRKELELKVKSQALVEIIAQSQSDDPKKRLEASKYLYEKASIREKNTKGRPSKDQIKQEAIQQAREQKIIDEHWNVFKEKHIN